MSGSAPQPGSSSLTGLTLLCVKPTGYTELVPYNLTEATAQEMRSASLGLVSAVTLASNDQQLDKLINEKAAWLSASALKELANLSTVVGNELKASFAAPPAASKSSASSAIKKPASKAAPSGKSASSGSQLALDYKFSSGPDLRLLINYSVAPGTTNTTFLGAGATVTQNVGRADLSASFSLDTSKKASGPPLVATR
jgi:hypothetical protein